MPDHDEDTLAILDTELSELRETLGAAKSGDEESGSNRRNISRSRKAGALLSSGAPLRMAS
jgi:hypothetical protein